MAVIAVGGFQHETNTFAPSKADYNAFEQGGGWPPLTFGEAIAPRLAGANIPATGAFATLHAAGHRTPGLAWGAASPSAHVTRDAFERIVGEMTARLAQAGAVDGVYLDLHGAMVTEHLDDGEGEILARVRRIVGSHVPVIASLDLHANVTRAMMEFADGLVAYRTYPHIDMAATGTRAARAPRAHARRRPAAGEGDASARLPHRPVVAVDVHRARPPPVRRARAARARARRRAVVHAGLPDGGLSRMPDGGVRLRAGPGARRARGRRARACGARRRARVRARPLQSRRSGGARDAARRRRRAGRAGRHAGQPGRGRQRRHHGPAGVAARPAIRATRCWAC